MIVADTSALMEILLEQPDAESCAAVLEAELQVAMSAGTMAEALIVAGRRGVGAEMAALIDGLGIAVEPVSPAEARRVAEAYRRWGKGVHPASLNFGDCFAYALAKELDVPLLYVGEDFARTDVKAAMT
ncbi:MAG TPA: type II toxin-antitoxin system VapC family toxin [Allosphingosinicella sp.]